MSDKHRNCVMCGKAYKARIKKLEEENEELDKSATERQLEIYRLRKALEEIQKINANERGTEAQRKMGMMAAKALDT